MAFFMNVFKEQLIGKTPGKNHEICRYKTTIPSKLNLITKFTKPIFALLTLKIISTWVDSSTLTTLVEKIKFFWTTESSSPCFTD